MNRPTHFRCYFCNKDVENDTREGHASICSSVLEPCPNKCGSYVARNMRKKHLQRCQNMMNRRSWTSTDGEHYERSFPGSVNGMSQTNLASRKYSESSLNLAGGYDRKPPNYYQVFEHTLKDLALKVASLNNDHLQHVSVQQKALFKITSDLNNQSLNLQGIYQWRDHNQYQLDRITKEIESYDSLRINNEKSSNKLQEISNELANVVLSLNTQKVAFRTEQVDIRQSLNDLNARVEEVRDTFVQENAVVAALWNDQKQAIEKINSDNETFEKHLMEMKEKTNNLSFEVRTANELIADCLEKIKKQEAQILELKGNVTQTKLEVELAEDSFSNVQGLVSTGPGRIIWKITDFAMRLEQAKKHERTPMKGPIFYTEDYGYRVRLLVFLNGLKKWKGRYLLACLHVIKGDYDGLLKWPCRIEANILLRDIENIDNPSNYTRYITAKREIPNDEAEEPQESSTQYVFIPHATLTKSNHLKDDSFFLEIMVNKSRPKNETPM